MERVNKTGGDGEVAGVG